MICTNTDHHVNTLSTIKKEKKNTVPKNKHSRNVELRYLAENRKLRCDGHFA